MRSVLTVARRIAVVGVLVATSGCGDEPGASVTTCNPTDFDCIYSGAREMFVAFVKDETINPAPVSTLLAAQALRSGPAGMARELARLEADIGIEGNVGLWTGFAVRDLRITGRQDVAHAVFDTFAGNDYQKRGLQIGACPVLAKFASIERNLEAAKRFADCAVGTSGQVTEVRDILGQVVAAAAWGHGLPGIVKIYDTTFKSANRRDDPKFAALFSILNSTTSIEIGEAAVYHDADPEVLSRAVAEGGGAYGNLRRTRDFNYYASIGPVVADLSRVRGGERLEVGVLQRHRETARGSLPLAALALAIAADHVRRGDVASARVAMTFFEANSGNVFGDRELGLDATHKHLAIADYISTRIALGDDRNAILDVVVGSRWENGLNNAFGIVRAGDAETVRIATSRALEKLSMIDKRDDDEKQSRVTAAATAALLASAFLR